MKGIFSVLFVSLICLSGLWAEELQTLDYSARELKDRSSENDVLVVFSIDAYRDILGTSIGPSGASVVKVQPEIGRRIIPARDTRLFADTRVFFFDQVKVGEVYKLYDFAWRIEAISVSINYVVAPGVVGTTGKIVIEKPGVIFGGAYSYDKGVKRDPKLTEKEAMKAALANLSAFPKWKAAVEARIGELK